MTETEKIIDFHSRGYTDATIAKLTGRSDSYIGHVRWELNLLSATQIKINNLKEEVKKLSSQGLTDLAIGKILNRNYRTISYYRHILDLPASMPENTYVCDSDRIKGYIIRNTKFMAKKRNIEFNLHYTDLELPEYCPLLGMKLTYRRESEQNHPSHASLDRIDNTKGYIKGNVIVISRMANAMKNCANFEQLEIFSKNILLLINNYKNQGALGSITDIFPDITLKI